MKVDLKFLILQKFQKNQSKRIQLKLYQNSITLTIIRSVSFVWTKHHMILFILYSPLNYSLKLFSSSNMNSRITFTHKFNYRFILIPINKFWRENQQAQLGYLCDSSCVEDWFKMPIGLFIQNQIHNVYGWDRRLKTRIKQVNKSNAGKWYVFTHDIDYSLQRCYD